MSVEALLETAYAKVLRDCEPTLADVAIRLNTALLNQAPVPSEDGNEDQSQEDIEQVPVPYVLLTATRGEESIPNTGIFDTELTIEVAANARPASDDNGLDNYFGAAIRPLFYKEITLPTEPPTTQTLFQALSANVPGLTAYGMPQRASGGEQEQEGLVVMRRIKSTFICGQ